MTEPKASPITSKTTDGHIRLLSGWRLDVADKSELGCELRIFTPPGRLHDTILLSAADMGRLAARLKQGPTDAPRFPDPVEDRMVSPQDWLRAYAEIWADAEERGVVVSDVREEDPMVEAFGRIAAYIDALEAKLTARKVP